MGFGKLTKGMGVQGGPRMLFTGQARTKPVLTVELIPRTTWAKNLRSLVEQEVWDVLRKQAYRKARYKCEVCSGRGPKWPVECHERWSFDRTTRIQTLDGLIALCPDCHAVKHWGFSRTQGKEAECRDHLAFVNGWSQKQIDQHLEEMFDRWKDRSRIQWDIDLTVLSTGYGISRDVVGELYRGRRGAIVSPELAPDEYAGPEEVPWDDIPEECL